MGFDVAQDDRHAADPVTGATPSSAATCPEPSATSSTFPHSNIDPEWTARRFDQEIGFDLELDPEPRQAAVDPMRLGIHAEIGHRSGAAARLSIPSSHSAKAKTTPPLRSATMRRLSALPKPISLALHSLGMAGSIHPNSFLQNKFKPSEASLRLHAVRDAD